MNKEPMTDDQVKSLLKREYPELFPQDIDRIAKTCRSEKWFLQLVKSKRLSEDLKTGGGPVIVAANAGGMAKDETPAVCEEKYGAAEQYDEEAESKKPDRERDIKAVEWAIELMLSTHNDRLRHMRASIAIAILNNNLNREEISNHFSVTPKRVTQVVQEVKSRRISN